MLLLDERADEHNRYWTTLEGSVCYYRAAKTFVGHGNIEYYGDPKVWVLENVDIVRKGTILFIYLHAAPSTSAREETEHALLDISGGRYSSDENVAVSFGEQCNDFCDVMWVGEKGLQKRCLTREMILVEYSVDE